MGCSRNASSAGPTSCRTARIRRPTRVTTLVLVVIFTCPMRSSLERNRAISAGVSASGSVSSVTVTLLSEVETRSTESPRSPKQVNTSLRKPTRRHIPSVSSDTSGTPLRSMTALTCALSDSSAGPTRVPGSSGCSVERTVMPIRVSRSGAIDSGCSTPPPEVAISCASA